MGARDASRQGQSRVCGLARWQNEESRRGPGSRPLSTRRQKQLCSQEAALAITAPPHPAASLGRGGAVVAAERATLLSHFRVTPASDCWLG